MKIVNPVVLFTLFFGICPLCCTITAAAAPAAQSSLSNTVSTPSDPVHSDSEVIKAQQNLQSVTNEYQIGEKSASDVSSAVIELSQAQIGAALPNDNVPDIQEALATIVTQRQLIVDTLKTQNTQGISDDAELLKAKTNLAQANASAALYTISALRKQMLSRVEQFVRIGSDTQQDLDAAKDSYQRALAMFTESERPS